MLVDEVDDIIGAMEFLERAEGRADYVYLDMGDWGTGIGVVFFGHLIASRIPESLFPIPQSLYHPKPLTNQRHLLALSHPHLATI